MGPYTPPSTSCIGCRHFPNPYHKTWPTIPYGFKPVRYQGGMCKFGISEFLVVALYMTLTLSLYHNLNAYLATYTKKSKLLL